MKINLMSDLHVEFCEMPPMPGGETLLLSGDILVGAFLDKRRTDSSATKRRTWFKNFLKECSEKYQNVYYIAGNHEYYHGDLKEIPGILREQTLKYSNVRYLHNESVVLTENTILFGGTLWTNMNNKDPIALMVADGGMNDFSGTIKNGKTDGPYSHSLRYRTIDSVAEHEITMSNLLTALIEHPDKEFLVMTHHAPSFLSIHPMYAGDTLNYAYSSDLSEFLLNTPRIKNWVHGHTHHTFNYTLGETHIMCNPRGYTYNVNILPENKSFDINFTFEVQ